MLMCKPNAIAWVVLCIFLSIGSALAGTLSSVRFGSHQGFDRVVCEFADPVKYEIVATKDGYTEVKLRNTSVDEQFFLPKLPPQIKLITSVEAFREGDYDIVLEVRGVTPLDAKPIELQGETWRLAIDFSTQKVTPPSVTQPVMEQTPETSKPKHDKKAKSADGPEYVPGDKPLETRMAEAEPKPVEKKAEEPKKVEGQKQVAPIEPPKPDPVALKPVESQADTCDTTALRIDESQLVAKDSKLVDTAKAFEVLAEFFDLMGDEPKARSYAKLYFDKTDVGAVDKLAQPTQSDANEEQQATWPIWLLAAVAFIAGIAGGILGNRLRMPKFDSSFVKLKFPTLKLPKRAKKAVETDPVHELAKDLADLNKAVAQERPAKPPLTPGGAKTVVPKEVVEEAEQDFPDDEQPATVEAAMKESLMDRRVKRVLELSGQNKTLAEIAQELDMGQDEVKLILDLNA